MNSGQEIDLKKYFDLPSEPFTEEEVSTILAAVRNTINLRFAKDEDVPKTILINYFGIQNSGKTKNTENIDRVFRRNGFKVFCPPETAEIEEVRSEMVKNPPIFQAVHLTGVQDQYFNLAFHPRCHVVQTSRGIIDMDYWYEKGLRKGLYTEAHVHRVREFIYELLRQDLTDAFFFFTCSVEAAMRREYEQSVTQKRGSKMNEKDVAEAIEIYQKVLDGINTNIPGLPIHHIDTSDMSIKQMGEEVLRFLLPTICNRFNVPIWRFMPYAPSLIQKKANRSFYFEEQLKFIGRPNEKRIARAGWSFVRESEQEDTYISSGVEDKDFRLFGEASRIRRDGGSIKFMYKTAHQDRMLSHRRPVTFDISPDESEKIIKTHKTIAVLRKYRRHFKKEGPAGEDHFFTLHLDSVDGLGNYTEIRARGSSDRTHTQELLMLAQELGLGVSSMVEGSYLSIYLKNTKKSPF